MKLKKSHIPDKKFIKAQLERGMKVELEHTSSRKIAKDIAKAHLIESGRITKTGKISSKYYDELYKMEKKLRRRRNG